MLQLGKCHYVHYDTYQHLFYFANFEMTRLDLTMASRVHLMEPGWNHMLERQALDRVHRLGQNREVLCTRYVVSGSDSVEQVCLLAIMSTPGN